MLNGKTSPSQSISAGIHQGSVIGPLLFVIYVNDVKHNILSSIKLFADDIALIKEINNPVNDFRELNNDLETLNSWSKEWLITFNADKTKYLIFSINLTNLPILPLSSQALEFRTPFFLIWSLPRLWYGSLSGSISLSHLSIFYSISCYNSLVLLSFVSRSSSRFT